MKKRDVLIDDVRKTLEKAGFVLSERHSVESICFDVIARRDETILIVKVLQNIDSLKRETTEEMRILSTTLHASPLIIGVTSGAGRLERGGIYTRYVIPIMSRETLYDYLVEEIPPYIFAAPGGFYVRLDSALLRQLRHMRNISLGDIAEIAGVSRRTVQLYCDGAGATIDAALKIEEFLGVPLILPLDPFKYEEENIDALRRLDSLDALERDIFQSLSSLGYDVFPTFRCPFDALTRDRRSVFLTGIEQEGRRLIVKARSISAISSIVRRQSVIFVERHRSHRDNIEGAPLIGRDELHKMKDSDKILDLIAKRKGKKD